MSGAAAGWRRAAPFRRRPLGLGGGALSESAVLLSRSPRPAVLLPEGCVVWLGAVASVSWISHLCECGFRRLFCLLSCCFAPGSLGFVDTADPRLSCCSVRRSGPALGQPVFGTDKQDGSFSRLLSVTSLGSACGSGRSRRRSHVGMGPSTDPGSDSSSVLSLAVGPDGQVICPIWPQFPCVESGSNKPIFLQGSRAVSIK